MDKIISRLQKYVLPFVIFLGILPLSCLLVCPILLLFIIIERFYPYWPIVRFFHYWPPFMARLSVVLFIVTIATLFTWFLMRRAQKKGYAADKATYYRFIGKFLLKVGFNLLILSFVPMLPFLVFHFIAMLIYFPLVVYLFIRPRELLGLGSAIFFLTTPLWMGCLFCWRADIAENTRKIKWLNLFFGSIVLSYILTIIVGMMLKAINIE